MPPGVRPAIPLSWTMGIPSAYATTATHDRGANRRAQPPAVGQDPGRARMADHLHGPPSAVRWKSGEGVFRSDREVHPVRQRARCARDQIGQHGTALRVTVHRPVDNP